MILTVITQGFTLYYYLYIFPLRQGTVVNILNRLRAGRSGVRIPPVATVYCLQNFQGPPGLLLV